MVHTLGLAAVLFGLWLLLSGHFVPLLIIVGMFSVGFVVAIVRRMERVDGEPLHARLRGWRYWPWLALEVVKCNLDVARRILSPGPAISPTLIRLKANQRTDLGKVIYANSITLTPGTVTVDVDGDEFVVHALTREAAEALQGGEMDRRVCRLEGEG